ncbi:MAG TPA: hypothetical protein PKA98_11960, partial [Acidimicrobiales bacterium]|nr:hypothetical protein [Acidimicrobiales bacterium]
RENALGAWVGADVQNASGGGQKRATPAPPGRAMTFDINLVNDGNVADRFGVRGQPAVPGFKVQYFDDEGNNISRAVKTGTYRTDKLAPGASTQIHLVITVKANTAAGASVTRIVRINSRRDFGAVDAVKVTLTQGPLPTLGPVIGSASAEQEVAALAPSVFCYLEPA